MTGTRTLPSRVRAAWDSRSPRERLLLGGLAVLLLGYLAIVLAVQPLLASRSAARAAISSHEAAIARLADVPDRAAAALAPASSPVTGVLTETAPAFGLAIRRIEPEGAGARLVLEDAEFTAVLMWLEEIERTHGILPAAVEMDRRPEPGAVSVRLSLAR